MHAAAVDAAPLSTTARASATPPNSISIASTVHRRCTDPLSPILPTRSRRGRHPVRRPRIGSKSPHDIQIAVLRDDGEGASHEEREEYRRMVSKTFKSKEEGFQFYNEYAKVKALVLGRKR